MMTGVLSRVLCRLHPTYPEAERYPKQAFKVLGLRPSASPETVKKAYELLARQRDPNRFAYDGRLERRVREILKELDDAYATIKEYHRKVPRTTCNGPREKTGVKS